MTRVILLLSLFFISTNYGLASHVVGGDLTVRRVSANNYEITLTFYRNCNSTTGYESTIYVGVYNKGTNAQVKVVPISTPTVTTLTLGDACYTPNLCIQKAIYKTSSNVVLANNSTGYYFSWMRCCRTTAINNISSPGNEGYIFYAEICDPSVANSNPTFNSTPDGYMCRNFQNYDDFSATDADGDQLTYAFAAPLSCNPTGQCSSTSPAPSTSTANLPDPNPATVTYGSVTWASPYSLTNILGDPSMSISSSGIISSTPPTLGIFVLSVVVSEWRVISGVTTKIGEIRRDFQFEVKGCSLVQISTNPGNPMCTGNTATVTASGAPSGYTYTWSTGATGTSITVSPTASGTYNYSVTASNGTCSSTTPLYLVVNSTPTATITTSGNLCYGGSTTLTASGGTTYSWSNGSTSSVLTGNTNATYTVWATNSSGCTSSGATGSTIQPLPVGYTYTWTGGGNTTSNNWFDSNNWGNAGGCIPSCSNDVIIPSTAGLPLTNPPKIDVASGAAACKSITIANGNTLTFSSASAELDVCGDFYQSGAISMGTNGKVKFTGSVAQNFYKYSTATGDLNNVELANTASGTSAMLTIKEGVGYQDMSLGTSGVFTFTSGMLATEGGKLLIVKNTSGSAITGHGTTRYVFGRVARYVASGSAYDFPVGNTPVGATVYPYELMNISFTSVPAGTFFTSSFENPANAAFTYSVSYGGGLPLAENGGSYSALVDIGGTNTGTGVSGPTGGIWTVIPNNGTSADYGLSVGYNMTLYGRNYDNSGSVSHTVVKRNTFCGASWTLPGAYSSSSISGNVITAYRTGASGFSQFGIAKNNSPLPIELLSFSSVCDHSDVVLSWATATEFNNDHFTLERSCGENGFQFQFIGTVRGSGNSSSVRTYSYTDREAPSESCIYRLSQTDYNGTTEAFAPISVNCNRGLDFNFVGIYPNPTEDDAVLFFISENEHAIALDLTDVTGQALLRKSIEPVKGMNTLKLSMRNFSEGVYFIKLSNGTRSYVKKVVKKS